MTKDSQDVKTDNTVEETIENPIKTEPKLDDKKKHHKHITHEEYEDLKNTLQRLQAEFENYKKRTEKENQQFVKNANASLIREILAVLDSFELAIKNSSTNNNPEIATFKKGMELIYAQLFSTLESQGLRIIKTDKQLFDPYKHEVLMVKESAEKEDMILQEFQKGYMLNDIVLRHSKVMITKHKEGESDGTQQKQ